MSPNTPISWDQENPNTLLCLTVFILSDLRLGSPCGSPGKESTCNSGDLGSIPGMGRAPGEGNSIALQYSCLENSMETGGL